MIVGELVDDGFAEIRTGPFGTQLKAADYTNSGRPVLNVRNVGFGEVRPEKLEFVDEATADRLSGHILEEGDIVFGRKGAVERHAFIQSEYAGALQGSDCIRLRLSWDAPIRPGFVTFALRTPAHQAWMKSYCSHGATMASLNQEILRQIEFPDLDLAVQGAVVDVLQSIDDLIENNRRRVEVLEEMARAIYREWFVHFRLPGHEDATFVDSDLGPIPHGWQRATLGGLVELRRQTIGPAEVEAKTPVVGLADLPRRSLTLDDWSLAADVGSRKRVFDAGDVLFGKIRPYFHKVVLAPMAGVCSTDAMVFDVSGPNRGQAVMALSSDEVVAYATQTSNGTKMPRANWDVVKQHPTFVPPMALAKEFTQLVHEITSMCSTLMFSSRKLTGLRDLLLPKLVTGEIEVSDLDLDAVVERAGV